RSLTTPPVTVDRTRIVFVPDFGGIARCLPSGLITVDVPVGTTRSSPTVSFERTSITFQRIESRPVPWATNGDGEAGNNNLVLPAPPPGSGTPTFMFSGISNSSKGGSDPAFQTPPELSVSGRSSRNGTSIADSVGASGVSTAATSSVGEAGEGL